MGPYRSSASISTHHQPSSRSSSPSNMEHVAHTLDSNSNARAASFGFLGCGARDVARDEADEVIIADNIAAPYGAFEPTPELCRELSHTTIATSAFASDSGQPPPASEAEEIVAGDDRLPAAARNSCCQSPTPLAQTSPARPLPVAPAPVGPGLTETCSDRSQPPFRSWNIGLLMRGYSFRKSSREPG